VEAGLLAGERICRMHGTKALLVQGAMAFQPSALTEGDAKAL
jgi:hypothetical protein